MFKGKKRPAAEEAEQAVAMPMENGAAREPLGRPEPVVRKIAVLDADEAAAKQPVAVETSVAIVDAEPAVADQALSEAMPVEPEMLQVLHIPGETNPAQRPSHREIAEDAADEADMDEWDDDDYDDEEPQLPLGKRLLLGLRNALIGVVVLAALLVGAGAGYTYFMGGNGSMPTSTPVAVTAPDPTAGMVKPRKPSPKVPESASVQFVTTPVKPGGAVSLSVRTLPASSCTIIVDHKHVAITIAGLHKETADDFGTVSWDWTMPKTMPIGPATATVTCSYQGRSAVVTGDITVQR